MGQPVDQGSIEKSMRRSSIPTSIPLFEQNDCDSDELSVVTTETFGVGKAIFGLHFTVEPDNVGDSLPSPLPTPSSVQRLLRLLGRSSSHA